MTTNTFSMETQLAAETRPFSLPVYLLIVTVCSWPFQIAFAVFGTTPFLSYLLSSLAMVMVAAGTFIAGRLVFRDGFRSAGWNWGKPRHYLWTLSLALFIFAVPAALELIFKVRVLPGGVPLMAILGSFIVRFLATCIPGFGEEFGWRGYMLPRLARTMSTRKALLVHGLIWWAWHIPMLVGLAVKGGGIEGPVEGRIALMLLITLLPSVMNAVLFAYVWSASGSLAVASAYHAAYDEVRDAIEHSIGFGPLAPVWEMAATTLLGLLVLCKGKWNLHRP